MFAKKTWSIVAGVSAAVAGLLAAHLLEVSWRGATGNEPPENPESPNTSWPEAFGFAILSGVILGLARLLARRLAARGWRSATGELPPGLETAG